MTTKQTILRNLGIVVLTTGLLACDGADERRAKYMAEGKQLMQAGDYEKAALAFKNVVQIDPKDWESHYQLGEVFYKQGKIDAAFKEYNTVVTQDPNHVMARVRVGQLLFINRNIEGAEKMADEALAKQPDNVEALVLKAGVQAVQNNSEAGIATVEKALQISPNDLSAILRLAAINASLDRMDKAVGILKDAIAKSPENIPFRSMLAGIYARKHQLVETEEMLASIIKIQPKEVQHYKNLAVFQLNNNEMDKAEATLRDAVQQIPDSDAAKSILVNFLVTKRNPDLAIAELLPMIKKSPEDYALKFKLVDVELEKKDMANAEAILKEVIDQDKLSPNGISARNKLATIYTLTNRVEEAKSLIKEVLEANPRDGEALVLRGQIALAENKIPDAITDFRSVLVDQPKNVTVLKMLATAHARNNEDSLARESMEKAVVLAPGDEAAQLELTGLYLKAGLKDQAKQQIESLLKVNQKSLRGLEAQFEIDISEKQWDKAQEIARQVQQIYSKDPTGFYMSGLGYKAENKLEASAEAFRQALARKPDAIEPLNELIKIYRDLKRPDKALELLQQLVKQHPDYMIAYNLLGGVYMDQKNFSEAKIAFQKALEIKPDWFGPYHNLHLIELNQNNKAEAINILKKGIEKSKGSLELVIDLARLYHKEGEHKKVLALYEESYKAHPESPVAINNLASYLSDYAATPENLDRAAKLAEPLLKFNNASLLDTVAWIAYKQGNYEKAKEILTRVVKLESASIVNQYHLGMAYFKLNDKPKASEYLQKAIDSKVNFDGLDEAKETLKKIKATS